MLHGKKYTQLRLEERTMIQTQLSKGFKPSQIAQRWVDAINRVGQYGQWIYLVVRDPVDLPLMLDTMCGQSA